MLDKKRENLKAALFEFEMHLKDNAKDEANYNIIKDSFVKIRSSLDILVENSI